MKLNVSKKWRDPESFIINFGEESGATLYIHFFEGCGTRGGWRWVGCRVPSADGNGQIKPIASGVRTDTEAEEVNASVW